MTDTLPATLPRAVTPAQQQQIVNVVRRAARAEITSRFGILDAGDISTKSRSDDLVTVADLAAEAMMTRALQIAFPHALVVGEEAAAKNPDLPAQIADAALAFVLDPIDGTWNYANGLAIFGTIVAVTQFGRPAFGLIYDPVADDWAIADDESSARIEHPSGIDTPLKASMGKSLEALTGFVPLNMFSAEMRPKVAETLPSFGGTHSLRCSAHEYRMVAQGRIDFLLTAELHPWDHLAGALICERAGAHVEMLDGGPYDASRLEGHLLVAPDRQTWNRLKKVFSFLV